MKILLGITSSIAAHKAPALASDLVKAGFTVKVVVTEHAKELVSPLSLAVSANNTVHTELFDLESETNISHTTLAKWPDLIVIAPATANFIAKLSHGLCDDLLTTICLASVAPILIVPAMNKNMWNHLATQDNVTVLQKRGIQFLGPEYGLQACGDIGLGRMVDITQITQYIKNQYTQIALNSKDQVCFVPDMTGVRVLLTVGRTIEHIDPVRYISNHSSGKMGIALANALSLSHATVTLVAAATDIPIPECLTNIIRVSSADQMLEVVLSNLDDNDIFIGTAAVADYKVSEIKSNKIKHDSHKTLTLNLVPTEDVLATVASRGKLFTVGFAAETENLIEHAKNKLTKKGIDMIIANDVSKSTIGFGSDYNEVHIITRDSLDPVLLPRATKQEIAYGIIRELYTYYYNGHKPSNL